MQKKPVVDVEVEIRTQAHSITGYRFMKEFLLTHTIRYRLMVSPGDFEIRV